MSIEPDPAFSVKPSTPYAGTTGFSGPGPSAARAAREANDGTAADRHARIMAILRDAGPVGVTCHEVDRKIGTHHGQSSGALSSMHKEGAITALTERRERSGVYVLPEHVNGRPERKFGGKDAREQFTLTKQEHELMETMQRFLAESNTARLNVRRSTVLTLLAAIKRAENHGR